MVKRFAIGDRVIVRDARATGVPRGTLGIVVQVFPRLPEVCDVQFDEEAERHVVLTNALAPAPASDAPSPAQA
jgi:hypothetical protein